MLKIYTSRITYSGPDKLDTTIKSASTDIGKLFAPTWEMVTGVKAYYGDNRWPKVKPISGEEYGQCYYQLLRDRYRKHTALFLNLIQQERVVLCCYCTEPEACHRSLAADILLKIAQHHGVDVILGGEIE